ncbi:MAG: CPBP family glutamic-type intramembrane protease [Chloroflexota bacterium]
MKQHPLLSFLILTFGLTWGIGACFILFPAPIGAFFGPPSVSNPLFILAVYAPGLSALIVTAVTGGPGGVGRLLARFFRWRGFLLPAVLKERSTLTTGLIVGFIWGIWHLPAFFVAGLPQNSDALPVFLVSLISHSVLMTWVFKGTGGVC